MHESAFAGAESFFPLLQEKLSSELASFERDLDEVKTLASAAWALADVDSARLHRTASGAAMLIAELVQINVSAHEASAAADLEAAALRKEIADLRHTVAEMAKSAELQSASASLAAATAAEAMQACDAVRREVVEELVQLQAEAADLTMALGAADGAAGLALEERQREVAGLRMALAEAEERANEATRMMGALQRRDIECELALEHTASELVRRVANTSARTHTDRHVRLFVFCALTHTRIDTFLRVY